MTSFSVFTTGQSSVRDEGLGKDLHMNLSTRSKGFQFFVTAIASLSLMLSIVPSANADSYNPLDTPLEKDAILNYVVENGSMERNSYLAIMPPAVTSATETRAD